MCDKKMTNKWNKEVDNQDYIVWLNTYDKATLKVIAKRFNPSVDNLEWEIRPEVDGRLGADIRVPNKKCAISMVSAMKKRISVYVEESNKTGNTFKETIRSMSEINTKKE